ncbi:MAG: hypothetical protein MJ247_05225 [Alphaproteobacteria bacterium]|nr:hypothetical protein [Alphaproteobacteria bacterium]
MNNFKKFFLTVAYVFVAIPTLINNTILKMNEAIYNKDIDGFMSFFSELYDGDLKELRLAVENDVAAFHDIHYDINLNKFYEDKETGVIKAKLFYLRSAKTGYFGSESQNGETIIEFVKEGSDSLKVVKMKEPRVYGIIKP